MSLKKKISKRALQAIKKWLSEAKQLKSKPKPTKRDIKKAERLEKRADKLRKGVESRKVVPPHIQTRKEAATRMSKKTSSKTPDYWREGGQKHRDWWDFTPAERKKFKAMKEKAKHKPLRVVDVEPVVEVEISVAPKGRRGRSEYTPDYTQTGSGSKRAGFQPDKPNKTKRKK